MDISGISGAVIANISNSSQTNGDAVTVKVLDKALEIQEQTAAQLLESIPDVTSSLGQNIDISV